MAPYIHSTYDRRIIWKPNRWFVVCDRLEADRTGDYALQCNWSLPGEGQQDDGCYRAAVEGDGGPRICWIKCGQRYPLRVTRSSIPFEPYAESSFPYSGRHVTRVGQVACGELQKGESREFTNLIYVSGPNRPRDLDVRAVQPGLAVLTGEEAALVVSANSLHYADAKLHVQADGAVLTESQATLFACRRFSWHSLEVQSSRPVDVAWDLTSGKMDVSAAETTQLTLATKDGATVDGNALPRQPDGMMNRIELSEGRHRLTRIACSPPKERRRAIARAAASRAVLPADKPETGKPLRALWEVSLPSPVASLASLPGPDGPLVLAGDSQGTVHALRDGRTEWTLATDGRVECMAVGRLDGGDPAVLVGSDDEHLYRLAPDGREVWRLKMGGDYSCEWWTLGCRSPVQAVLIADLSGDGNRQLVVGHGGMQVELVGADGKSQWRQTWYYGIPTTLAAVDGDGDGVKEIMTGGWIRSCTSSVKSFAHDGKPINGNLYGAGRTRRGFDCAGVPFLRYLHEGDASRAVVARSGPYCDVGLYDHGSQKLLWHRVVGDTVTGLELMDLDGDGAPEIIYSTQAGWVVAVDRLGKNLWAHQLTHAVSAFTPWGEQIAVGCRDGAIYSLDRRGRIAAQANITPGRTWLTTADADGKATLAVAAGDRVTLLQP